MTTSARRRMIRNAARVVNAIADAHPLYRLEGSTPESIQQSATRTGLARSGRLAELREEGINWSLVAERINLMARRADEATNRTFALRHPDVDCSPRAVESTRRVIRRAAVRQVER